MWYMWCELQLDEERKMVINLNDPEQPRFSMVDLKDVLHERNQLKTELISVKEELEQYKPEYLLHSLMLKLY